MTRGLRAAIIVALLTLAASIPSVGEVLTVGDIRIHSVDETGSYCRQLGGGTYLCFPGTRNWKLSSDGRQYHPMPLEVVVEAVRGVDYPMGAIDVDILILPVARQELPNSSAEGRVIFLSPGRVPYPLDHVHYTVVHEMGHIVHHVLMPWARRDLWQAYADLRGLPPSAMAPECEHASRISEIFAEDFRVLFGGSRARCGGQIENHDLASPEDVKGLREFMLSLRDEWKGRVVVTASPNPFQSSVVLRAFSLDEPVVFDGLTIYDVRGRKLWEFAPSPGMDEIVWDGRDQQGRPVAPGVYMLSMSSGSRRYVYKILKTSP